MKKHTHLIIGAVIVVLIIILLISRGNKQTINNIASLPNAENYCYLYESELIDEEGEIVGTDREYIEFARNPETSEIQGIHNVIPVSDSGHYATLIGVSDGGYMNTVATVQYEDTTWQEQRIYQLDEDRLYVGYQPVDIPRVKNEFGVYMYEDIYEIVFDTDVFYLEAMSCDEVDRTTVVKK